MARCRTGMTQRWKANANVVHQGDRQLIIIGDTVWARSRDSEGKLAYFGHSGLARALLLRGPGAACSATVDKEAR